MVDRIVFTRKPDRILLNSNTTRVVQFHKTRIVSGLRGIPGKTGPAGPSGGDAYEHIQSSASEEWVVNHNLGVRPSVSVFSLGGVEIGASVIHQSENQLRVYFAQPQTGSAHCV